MNLAKLHITCLALIFSASLLQAAEKKYLFNLEELPLSEVLQQFAAQADIQLIYSPDVLPDLTIQAVSGSYTLSEILTKLVQNTGLEFVLKGSVVVIRAKKAAENSADEGLSRNITQPKPTTPNLIEEFIVTAQKREERLQDVPIAITVVTGDQLNSSGIGRLESLAPLTPNFHFSEAVAANDQIFIRGLGSGVNFGFENAVGQVIDDFYYGRSRFGRAAFLDVERIEVLKGPQGTLTGKNTTAGAISIVSKTPTEAFEGWLAGAYEYEADQGYSLEGALSGPLAPGFSARLALRIDDRNGWVENVTTGNEEQSLQDITGRITLRWRPDNKTDLLLRYHSGELDRQGRTRELSRCGAALKAFIQAQGINEDCRVNLKRSTRGIRNGEGDFQNFLTDFNTWGLTLNRDFNRNRLTSLTGYAEYKTLDQLASGLIPVELLNLDARESWRQWTQELRLASDFEHGEYLLGIYYAQMEQRTSLDTHFADLVVGAPVTRVVSTRQKGDSVAVFGQFTWHINALLSATAGGRFNLEQEEARSVQFPAAIYTRTQKQVINGPAGGSHNVSQDRDESNFSPAFTLQWRPWEEGMLYASLRKGFKGGGFDHQLIAGQEEAELNFQFNEEQVIAYELGAKLITNSGRLQLNIAAFRNEFDNLQVSSVQENVTFNVGNAASAVTQGLELEGQWHLGKDLSISWAAAYLDAYYEDFKNAPCNGFQLLSHDADCTFISVTQGRQDLSGKRLQYAPEWSFTVEMEHRLNLSDRLIVISGLRFYYADAIALALDLDPNTVQQEYVKLDAQFTLTDSSNHWELALVGRNLGNEITSNFANDLAGKFSDGSYFRFSESPRAIAIRGLIRF